MTIYIVITPVKDEENHIKFTIESMIRQTIKPTQWIIVDDGSSDSTFEIISKYSENHSWIKGVSGGDKGPRQPGNRHLKAFYLGYKHIEATNWDYLVKLDGDLSFTEDYFEKCFSFFSKDKALGIGGGHIFNLINGELYPEKHPVFHVRGATKIYSRSCWEAIGGIPISPNYDTIDEIKANMLGFSTRTFLDLKVSHHRVTGSSSGFWKTSVKYGLGDYTSGYHPLFMLAKCVKRIFAKPYLLHSIGLLFGYLMGRINNTPKVEDKKLISYIRKQQINYLTFRKSIWR